ncbi:bifunctional aspartate kinase/homoserine dehydrogenase I [candidate division KSB1 bacterium]|nr:bifunctional aspartate kinase/homoserine dehydrogenase I [candidate division KSB1 bacterium]RQW00893.1 MAG: bifunctional aspartate kinase/homoserine dehydrogenase I [candidate division KSB1 bacterium]
MFRVVKFGGSSLATSDRVKNVAQITKSIAAEGYPTVLVVSAIGGITDQLIDCARTAEHNSAMAFEKLDKIKSRHYEVYPDEMNEQDTKKLILTYFEELSDILKAVSLIRVCSSRTLDYIVTYGERLNAQLLTRLLKRTGSLVEYIDGREIIVTDKKHDGARVLVDATYARIKARLAENLIYVVTGFIASSEDSVTTTLGRGGSDYTAALIGAALDVEKIEIWTDVDGFMSADPRIVDSAFVLPQVSYEEAMELSYFGAKVIHPETLRPAVQKGIPVWIKNSFSPEKAGTKISSTSNGSDHPVKGIASFHNISMINVQGSGMVGVPGVSGRLFGALAREGINVIMITQASSEHSICFVIQSKDANAAKRALQAEFEPELVSRKIDDIGIRDNLAIIAAVGENMAGHPGISGKLFEAIGENSINVVAIAQGSSERNVSLVVDELDAVMAVNVIHSAFYLSHRISNVFILGTGNIGATLLEQMKSGLDDLLNKNGLLIRVCGIANVDTMIIDDQGIDINNWESILSASDQKTDMDVLLQKIKAFKLQNSILVDVTASEFVASKYVDFLRAGIHIVTPNKKANTMSQTYYNELKSLTRDHRLHYLYETTVGAGLPLISTIQDLVQSGDDVLEIEGIFSGTLGFIFSALTAEKPFSTIVRQAYESGYTEPDPRDDLSGMDVARKILILAREIGLEMELGHVTVNSPLPLELSEGSLTDFWRKLPSVDADFERQRAKAEAEGKVIRFMASLKDGTCSVGITRVSREHVLSRADGTDNIIRITTKRYYDNPMTVQGPGAGREVTAGGIFANIINLSFHLP